MNSDLTLVTVASDQQLRTGENEDGTFTKGAILNAENNIGVKQEFLTSEDNNDIEFYHEIVKRIKCESIPSDSDVSVTGIDDILYKDNINSDNNSIKPKDQKISSQNQIKKLRKNQCAICNKKYSHKKSLNYHLKVHAGIKDYSCSICKKKFIQKCHLTQHEQIHTGIKNFECLICNKMFSQKYHLIAHEKIHTGIRNFKCLVCKKRFMKKSNLMAHKNIHTGTKNFECLVCKKRFMQKSHLVKHEKTHVDNANLMFNICGSRVNCFKISAI